MNKVILDFIKSGVEPLPDNTYGDGYRCSVYLKDRTYLPCVLLRHSRKVVELAIRRFEDEKSGKGCIRSENPYEDVVGNFVCHGNRVSDHEIAEVQHSRFAIPLHLLRQIHGETSMGWTGFVLEMRDGKYVSYGTTFLMEFFDIPEEYTFEDVVAVHNHSYVNSYGELKSLVSDRSDAPGYYASTVRRERPYFLCYLDL